MLFLITVIAVAFAAWLVYADRTNPVVAQSVPAPNSAMERAIARARTRFAMGEIDSRELEQIVSILRD